MRYLKSSELQLGMVVQCHGGRFRLATCYHGAEQAAEYAEGQKQAALALNERYGYQHTPEQLQALADEAWAGEHSCRGYRSDFLGNVEPGRECSIPANWRTTEHPWAIQGNDRVTWAVED